MPDGSSNILVIDPQIAGVSGDMMISALLDLGANTTNVIEAMKTPLYCHPACKNIEIAVADICKNGIRAKKLDIIIEEEIGHSTGVQLTQTLSICLQKLDISDRAREFASQTMETLIAAEAQVHGASIQDVHLHEMGSADTLVDIIGSAVALDDMGLFKGTGFYCTSIAVGGGVFRFSHGMVSSPAPATHEIIRSSGLLMQGGPVEKELATPTGVALLAALSPVTVRFYPQMKTTKIGYGAGTRELDGVPNVLKITLGEYVDYGLMRENIHVIETNLDDTAGEVIGYVTDLLLNEGAKDVSIIPMFTKKGRPGHIIKILADTADTERICSILTSETGTLGVRTYGCERRILNREIVPIEVAVGNKNEIVNVKVARTTTGRIIRIKPEYDDLKKLAGKTGRTFRELEELVSRKAGEVLS